MEKIMFDEYNEMNENDPFDHEPSVEEIKLIEKEYGIDD